MRGTSRKARRVSRRPGIRRISARCS